MLKAGDPLRDQDTQHLCLQQTRLRGWRNFECNPSFQMSFVLQMRGGATQITATLPEHVSGNTHLRFPSEQKLRAFLKYYSDGTGQHAEDEKVIILISRASGRKPAGFRSKSSRLCCLLIQNGVSVSQSVLSKIPTLS